MQIYFILFGKLARFHLGSWPVFIWEVDSLTTFAPSSVLLTSPHIIEVIKEAIRNKIYRNIAPNLNKVAQKRPTIHTRLRGIFIYIISYKVQKKVSKPQPYD